MIRLRRRTLRSAARCGLLALALLTGSCSSSDAPKHPAADESRAALPPDHSQPGLNAESEARPNPDAPGSDTISEKRLNTKASGIDTLSEPYGPPLPHPGITLAAIGDVLIHRTIYEDARIGDRFDFRPMLEPVRDILQQADIAIANQESVTGGSEIGLSDYPSFNSPFETADALQDAGIDVVTLANNHALDRGERALLRAIGHWRELGVEYAGASADRSDRMRLRTVERNGMKLAFLAYTYGTNGIPSPQGKDYLVHRLEPAALARDIAAAKERSDAVIVSLHFGSEYQRMPSVEQKRLARLAAISGAAVVIGHHPHVLQPMEWLDNGRGGRSLAVYSLGNFIAAQKQPGPYTRIGGIVQFELRKPPAPSPAPASGSINETLYGEAQMNKTARSAASQDIIVDKVSFLPTYIRFAAWKRYRVIPLAAARDDELPHAASVREELARHLRRWMPELRITDEHGLAD
ncbi:poly-gamma-glutamate synthesis protein (capsule biosynthesis protein) [Paenibacillus sp. UNCCL117]|uniref:CapA family protein n=1 Tax=unclassified Paenibacillus TaxID=185978 RepID=UPI0008825E0F|nr:MULTISPECIES: CapA family protein [unclassified Paenibacillus]SDE01982.1 poly-gamma-glutamate synthesis protein (capsule biosynthesis protein) [Paenibacillus sp. cl123]SFW57115.1 poly-gamma-glutamate synthesis protein (capsule biosynthesis protein) [Paenibacillus sp. UNCCL117]